MYSDVSYKSSNDSSSMRQALLITIKKRMVEKQPLVVTANRSLRPQATGILKSGHKVNHIISQYENKLDKNKIEQISGLQRMDEDEWFGRSKQAPQSWMSLLIPV